MAAQILSLNAGFSFAQTIDPTTQAQSGVLVVFAQLAGGMVFLALGLDRRGDPHPGLQPGSASGRRVDYAARGGGSDAPGWGHAGAGGAAGAAGDRAAGAGGYRAGAAGTAQRPTATVDPGFPSQDDWRRWCCSGGSRFWSPSSWRLMPAWYSARCARRCGSEGGGTRWRTTARKPKQPTPKRLDKARKEGQFPTARQFVSAMQFWHSWPCSRPGAGNGSPSCAELMRQALAAAFPSASPEPQIVELSRYLLLRVLTAAGARRGRAAAGDPGHATGRHATWREPEKADAGSADGSTRCRGCASCRARICPRCCGR